MSAHTKGPSTDPALWTTRRAFGVAGGPDEIVLTKEGEARAFSVGANVWPGAVQALEMLSTSDGYLSLRVGSRLKRTDLGRHDQITWGYLRERGLVASFQDDKGDGVRLTEAGHRAVADGFEERRHLLERCARAAIAKARGK